MTRAHVVIVDDNETGIKVLGEMLLALDVSFTAIQDPTHLEGISDELKHVDAIFLDLEMPKIDGYEMLTILKGDLRVSSPIIAYSVHTAEMSTAKELGFDGFLGKPLQRNHFQEQLERILSGEQVWEAG
jgi:CheY-like chemotaxis protein